MLGGWVAPELRRLRALLLAGLALAAVLVAVVLVRYPATPRDVGGGLVAIALLLATAGWVALRETRPGSDKTAGTLRLGAAVGLPLGILWVLEIAFNNVVPPDVSTGPARSLVDNAVWAAVSAATLLVGALATGRSRRMSSGARAGLWSGLVSGLLACLAGLLLITIGMSFLVRDPLMIAEYAERRAASGAPDLATYMAYETLAGAIGHLVVLGMALGAALGAVGGIVGKALQRLAGSAQRRWRRGWER